MESQKLLSDLTTELEEMLVARGQSSNAVAQYHYIFRIFLAYFRAHHESYFSQSTMDQCLREHYGITDQRILSSRQHYKKKVIRASKLLSELAAGKKLTDRYIEPKSLLITDSYTLAVTAFCNHLQKIGRSGKTIDSYRRYAARFLNHMERQGITQIADLSVDLINSYTLTLSGLNKATVKSTLGPIRIFLRFLYTNEYTEQDLSQFVGTVQMRSQTKIPSIWEKEDVLKLLTAIDRGNPSGKRDYAIILLIARLGVRVGDVNKLKFENIDWRKGCIRFVQSKTQNPVCLPLLKDVGWAIIDYVQNGRPKINSPYIFLTHTPPFKNYADENHLHATIQKYMAMTDIQNQPRKKRGMHSLRYSLANRLQENRETAHTISSALGHSRPDSAAVYVKTDIDLLRECALTPSEVGIWLL